MITGYKEWAQSLVGRDWEIFWNDEEDKCAEKNSAVENKEQEDMRIEKVDLGTHVEKRDSGMQVEKEPDGIQPKKGEDDMQVEDGMQVEKGGNGMQDERGDDGMQTEKRDEGIQTERGENGIQTEKGENGTQTQKGENGIQTEKGESGIQTEKGESGIQTDKDDDESEGSVIDDWYAGHVLSLVEPENGGKISFKVRFVGDEELYDMELDPSKVRPSARGWIKRTKALLCSSKLSTDDGKSWDVLLPPDSGTAEDQNALSVIQKELNSKTYSAFVIPEQKDFVQIPSMRDLLNLFRLRYLLKAQIFLRSRLAPIVNHHGSIQYVDGEPNPREAYVDHLTQCCVDLDQLCDWYCRCWELLSTFFCHVTNMGSIRETATMTFDDLFNQFLEFGKKSISSCATMDLSPTASKRRQVPWPTTTSARRPKRRRKKRSWSDSLTETMDNDTEVGELMSTRYVDQFVASLRDTVDLWCISLCLKMLQTLSHYIINPVVDWKNKVRDLLDENNEASEMLREEKEEENGDTSESDGGEERNEVLQEEKFHFFSYEDVESCAAFQKTHIVLSRLDLSKEEGKLKEKLLDIAALEEKGFSLLLRIAEDSGEASKQKDNVLLGLKAVLAATRSSGSSISNIEPIGRSGTPLTRDVLERAIEVRQWLVDVKHAELVRERCAFVEDLIARMSKLPQLMDVPQLTENSLFLSRREGAARSLQKISARLVEYTLKFEKYRTELDQYDSTIESSLSYKSGVWEALEELSNCPVISSVEEKIAARADILEWHKDTKVVLNENGGNIEYTKLERLHTSLESILAGSSQTRSKLSKSLEANDVIEREINTFASVDLKAICGSLVERVGLLYTRASKWKERAESIISTLSLHGNETVGESHPSPKPPAMVDIKRIHDLIGEYESMNVDLSGHKSILKRVEEEAIKWSSGIQSTVSDRNLSLKDCFTFLQAKSDTRPRGILMDPARHVFDSILDALAWHMRVKEAVKFSSKELFVPEIRSSPPSMAETYSALITERFYPLLTEGTDAIAAFADTRGVPEQFLIRSGRCNEVLEKLFHIRRSARAFSRQKLESSILGSSILSRMIQPDADATEGYPLSLMLWIQWHLFVDEFISQCTRSSNDEKERKDFTLIKSHSLDKAKDLRSEQPVISNHDEGISSDVKVMITTDSTELRELDCMIISAEKEESDSRELLLKSRDMLKGGIQKADFVRQHLTELKDSLNKMKDRASGKGGLVLSQTIERQVEHHIKIFAWLVSFLFKMLWSLENPILTSISFNQTGPYLRISSSAR